VSATPGGFNLLRRAPCHATIPVPHSAELHEIMTLALIVLIYPQRHSIINITISRLPSRRK
jgi:hypothetical protein